MSTKLDTKLLMEGTVAFLHKHRFVHETCWKTFIDEQMQGGDDSYNPY